MPILDKTGSIFWMIFTSSSETSVKLELPPWATLHIQEPAAGRRKDAPIICPLTTTIRLSPSPTLFRNLTPK